MNDQLCDAYGLGPSGVEPNLSGQTPEVPENLLRIRPRHLLRRDAVLARLELSDEQVQSLVNTRQLTVIRIQGEERFDSDDLDRLIETYKATAARRAK